jgi:hypothetical protein
MKKSMRKRKAKKVSIVAKNKLAKLTVWRGTAGKTKTSGGLTKANLIKNKSGKIVSKKASAQGKARKFPKAVVAARKALGIKGFCPIGGKTAAGQRLLKKARSLYRK